MLVIAERERHEEPDAYDTCIDKVTDLVRWTSDVVYSMFVATLHAACGDDEARAIECGNREVLLHMLNGSRLAVSLFVKYVVDEQIRANEKIHANISREALDAANRRATESINGYAVSESGRLFTDMFRVATMSRSNEKYKIKHHMIENTDLYRRHWSTFTPLVWWWLHLTAAKTTSVYAFFKMLDIILPLYLIILFNLIIPTLLSLVGGTLSGNGCGSPNHL